MLQIISKKFFKTNDFYKTSRNIEVYSNINTKCKICTPIATMDPKETKNGITTYVLSYDNVIEKQKSTHLQLVAVCDNYIIEDFLDCCSFWFKGMFSTDREYVMSLIRKEKIDSNDIYLPRDIVPNIFGENITIPTEYVNGFNDFMKKLIGIPRKVYLNVIKVIREYKNALLMINYNLELSYTMLVASIESLAQKFDNYETKWEDCPKELTIALDKVLASVDYNIADKIRKVIISDSHVQLSSRYHAFVLEYLSESYYREDALNVKNPCRESQLSKALTNSYKLRSGYVHMLKEIPKLIKIGGESEILSDNNQYYFTFPGLIRLVRHIVIEFINRQEYVEKEDVDYFNELPGFVSARLAPEYWIYKEQYLNSRTSVKYLEGFLEYYMNITINNKKEVINLNSICKRIELVIKGLAKDEQKIPMVDLYILYNSLLEEEIRYPNWKEFLEKYNQITEIPSIENAMVYLLTGNELPWDLAMILDIYKKYDNNRNKKDIIKIPNLLEVWLLLEIANLSVQSNKFDLYKEIITKALHERPGDRFILDLVNRAEVDRSMGMINWRNNYIKV